MIPTYEQLVAFARKLSGETLQTRQRGKPFEVSVVAGAVEVTPGSGMPRALSRKSVEEVLERFRESGSYSPGHYADVTFNASYVLTLIHEWQSCN